MGNSSYCCAGPDGEKNEVVVGDDGSRTFEQDLKNAKYEERTYQVGTYAGQMLNSQRCGYGVCKYNSGPSYKGQWWQDKCHGEGTFQDSDSTYSGQWSHGKKHGRGEETWSDDGTRYVGDHFQGNKHGIRTLRVGHSIIHEINRSMCLCKRNRKRMQEQDVVMSSIAVLDISSAGSVPYRSIDHAEYITPDGRMSLSFWNL